MNILAFDTCLDACSVAVSAGLGGAPTRITSQCEVMQTGHAERLIPMIAAVMTGAGLGWDHIDRIGVTTGPGTFTGTRICVSTARALALARALPVVAISSLEVVALGLAETPRDPQCVVLAVVDARRDEVYVQLFDGADLLPLSPPGVLPIGDAALLGGARPLLIAGSGADRVATAARTLGRAVVGVCPEMRPDIAHAMHRITALPPATGAIRPLYLRPPDAKPQDGKAIPRAVSVTGS